MDPVNYKAILEQSPALLMVIDTGFNIVTASGEFLAATKTELKNITGKNLFDVFPGNSYESDTNGENIIRISLNRVLQNKTADILPVTKYIIPTPGSAGGEFEVKYWKPVHTPVFDEFNNVKYFIQRVEDVTENEAIRAQLDLERKLLTRMENSEHRYEEMVQSSPSMIAILKGEDMIIEIANEPILETWGKGKDVFGKSLLTVMPEIVEQGFNELFHQVYTTGEPNYGYEVPVHVMRNGKKELSYYNFVYQAQRDIHDRIEGVAIIASEVTPQAILKNKLQESEEQFRALIKQAPVAICILKGNDYMVEVANDFYLQLVEKEPGFIGKALFDSLPELVNQGIKELLDGVMQTGMAYYGNEREIHILRNNKRTQGFFNFVYQPLREADNTITGIMVVVTEVTDLVLSRKRMEVQTAQFEEMLMTAPGFVATLTGPDHVYSLVNQQYQGLFGKRRIKGKPIMVALPELEGQGFDKLLDRVYTTGEPYVGIDIPITLARDENLPPELRYFNFSYQPMHDEHKKIYAILIFGYEVTEQMIAKKRIEESEVHFRQMADLMPAKISNADTEGNLLYFNRHWLDYAGLDFEELRDFGYRKVIHPDDLAEFQKRFQDATDTATVLRMQMRFLNRNGDYKWHLNLASPVLDEYGKIKMWIGSTTEIHDQVTQKVALEEAVIERTRQLELVNKELKVQNNDKEKRSAELNFANRELLFQNEEKEKRAVELMIANKELEAFTYVSSHDLQEPLRKIQTFSSYIQEKEIQNLSEKGQHHFERIQSAARSMQQLIQDLIAFSRLNKTEREFEYTSLSGVFEKVKSELKETIAEKHAILEIKGSCDAHIIVFQFHQLLHNLVSNALKFSRKGIPPHIILQSRVEKGSRLNAKDLLPEKNYCHISVTDNGIGFEPHYSESIFKVFQRLHSKDVYPGTGIGLAIVKKIVENHNGTITATSEAGKGARFDIYIPADSHPEQV